MRQQKKKGQSCAVIKTPTTFIPNIWLSVNLGSRGDTDHYLRSAFCEKDKMQWFFLVKTQKGFNEFEPVKCECCGGKLWRDGLGSGFSGTDVEVVGWLQEHPTEKKTLVLVFTLFNLEHLKNILQEHLLMHNFSGSYTKLITMESGQNFQKIFAHSNKKKLLSSLCLLDTKEIKKQKPKKEDNNILVAKVATSALEEKEYTEDTQQDLLRRLKFSELAKKALKKFQEPTEYDNSLQAFNKFRKNQKILNLQSPSLNLKTAWKDLRKLRKFIIRKHASPSLSLLKLNRSVLRQKDAEMSKLIGRVKSKKKIKVSGLRPKKLRDLTFLRSRLYGK